MLHDGTQEAKLGTINQVARAHELSKSQIAWIRKNKAWSAWSETPPGTGMGRPINFKDARNPSQSMAVAK